MRISNCVCELGFGVCVVKMKDYSIAFIGIKPISQLHINRSIKVCVSVCLSLCVYVYVCLYVWMVFKIILSHI